MTLSDILTVVGIFVTVIGIAYGLSVSKKNKNTNIVTDNNNQTSKSGNNVKVGNIESKGDVKISGGNIIN